MALKLALSSPTDGGRSLGLTSRSQDMTPLGTISRNKNSELLPRDGWVSLRSPNIPRLSGWTNRYVTSCGYYTGNITGCPI
uniref:Uncharacterized protein n=1 Tax=Timema bartmani TaxID=61472 RepID=A0A7R9F4G3_9NEOP|nr:unnamed protein product [Timema bartmani]